MPFPQIQYCLVCDDVRPDLGNKLNILGFFGLLPFVDVIVGEWGKTTRLLFIVGTVTDADAEVGDYDINTTILNPDESELASTEPQRLTIKASERGILGFGFLVTFIEAGQHTFHLKQNGNIIFSGTFSVRKPPG
jgi:hypothetical protein